MNADHAATTSNVSGRGDPFGHAVLLLRHIVQCLPWVTCFDRARSTYMGVMNQPTSSAASSTSFFKTLHVWVAAAVAMGKAWRRWSSGWISVEVGHSAQSCWAEVVVRLRLGSFVRADRG